MILVTGATGNLGKATINSLISKGISANNIAALVRDESNPRNLNQEEFRYVLVTMRILTL